MSIHEGHRDRMKQEFLQGGLAHVSEPRVLELLLFYSRRQGDVNPLAHQLLDTFGSLAGVLDASPDDLRKVPGVGENTVVLLKLIPAIAARYLASRTSAEVILSDSATLHALFTPYFCPSWPASTARGNSWACAPSARAPPTPMRSAYGRSPPRPWP